MCKLYALTTRHHYGCAFMHRGHLQGSLHNLADCFTMLCTDDCLQGGRHHAAAETYLGRLRIARLWNLQ